MVTASLLQSARLPLTTLDTRKIHGSPNTDPYASIGHGIHHDATTSSAKDTESTHDLTAANTDDYRCSGHPCIHRADAQMTGGNVRNSKDSIKVGRSTLNSPSTSTHGSRNINAGLHGSKWANKLDPRVDSDLGKVNRPFVPFSTARNLKLTQCM